MKLANEMETIHSSVVAVGAAAAADKEWDPLVWAVVSTAIETILSIPNFDYILYILQVRDH